MTTEAQARKALAEATTLLRAKEATQAAGKTTLTSSLVEAIYMLDSAQVDVFSNPGTTVKPQFSDGSAIRKGRLQQIQDLRAQLFGGVDSNGLSNEGIFDALGI